MRPLNRKSTPRVTGGRTRTKNTWTETPNYYNRAQPLPVIDRRRPGIGYRHILHQQDIYDFIDILPEWDELAQGLHGIVLAPGEGNLHGYHCPGVVHICAWERDLWQPMIPTFYASHRDLFARLGVPCEPDPIEKGMVAQFTEETVRAFQLLHILLHELGHHHDRITTRTQVRAARGEPYAEAYAFHYEARIWMRYQEVFGTL